MLEDRKLILSGIAETVKIPKERVSNILHNIMHMKKP